MNTVAVDTCWICQCTLSGVDNSRGFAVFECPRCGPWAPFPPAPGYQGWTIQEQLTAQGPDQERRRRSVLSQVIRRQQDSGKTVGIRPDLLEAMGLNRSIGTPADQIDELILWTGAHQPSPDAGAIGTEMELSAWTGTLLSDNGPTANLWWLFGQPEIKSYLVVSPRDAGKIDLRLTMEGWTRYQQLAEARSTSRFAFMAMKFNDDELNMVVSDIFIPAVKDTGFELRTLNDGQGAGLIDDQLRVALRSCRFVLADVTHGNNGAYWEAGFAEGLGKPVIYTCREAEWNERKVHFDTNHLVTIIWNPDDLGLAATRLKATIRATLPMEAELEDPN